MKYIQTAEKIGRGGPRALLEGSTGAAELMTDVNPPSFNDNGISIKRNALGSIDYKYYATKARQIRSQSAGLFFKSIAFYVAILGSILVVMI